ncbi:MAG: hypothetical protein OXH85_10590 [Truepera sp.]|nr:hypothetical protein [Truepera sp.]
MRSARQLRRSLVSPLTTSTRSRSFLRIQPRSSPSASAWARSSAEGWGQPDPEGRFGYLEGTIRELIITEAETGTREKAVVQLPGGHVIEADLSTDDPFAPMDLPPFEVGQRVELYFSNAPDGQRQYVVSDWVRRPALLWLVALFLVVSVVVARLKGITTGTW